jgi:hypothetical protein
MEKSKYKEKREYHDELCKLYGLPLRTPYPVIRLHLGKRRPDRIKKRKRIDQK